MIKRLCLECGSEMMKELTPEGARFFCKKCDAHTIYDEVDMEAHCPECDEKIAVCSRCSHGFFCNKCNVLVSSKKVVWKKK